MCHAQTLLQLRLQPITWLHTSRCMSPTSTPGRTTTGFPSKLRTSTRPTPPVATVYPSMLRHYLTAHAHSYTYASYHSDSYPQYYTSPPPYNSPQQSDSFGLFSDQNPNGCSIM
ncbi:hypothetical protein ACFX13_010501 [Malus domestica]